jgi:hypothetical protein
MENWSWETPPGQAQPTGWGISPLQAPVPMLRGAWARPADPVRSQTALPLTDANRAGSALSGIREKPVRSAQQIALASFLFMTAAE